MTQSRFTFPQMFLITRKCTNCTIIRFRRWRCWTVYKTLFQIKFKKKYILKYLKCFNLNAHCNWHDISFWLKWHWYALTHLLRLLIIIFCQTFCDHSTLWNTKRKIIYKVAIFRVWIFLNFVSNHIIIYELRERERAMKGFYRKKEKSVKHEPFYYTCVRRWACCWCTSLPCSCSHQLTTSMNSPDSVISCL